MPAPANLVHETSTTTGTGNFTLVNVNGKNNFNDAFGTGGSDVFDYFISNQDAAEYERGTGHMSDATTLVRDTVIESTNSNNAVNFSAGTKDVTNDIPAANQIRNENSTVTDGHGVLFDGTTGRAIKSLGSAPVGGAVIASGALAAAGSVDIPLDGQAWDEVTIAFLGLTFSADNLELQARFDQGSGFLSGASDYGWSNTKGGADLADSEIQIVSGLEASGGGAHASFEIKMYRPGTAAIRKSLIFHGLFAEDSANNFGEFQGGGSLLANTNAVTDVRILLASGTMTGYYMAIGRIYS